MELVIVLVIALVVLGPKRLPDAGKAVGKGMREFKDSVSGKDDDEPVHQRLSQELEPAEERPVAQPQQAREREVT